MVDNAKRAADILTGVGGEDNVRSLVHCMTRLRFVLVDEGKADAATLKAIPGVLTVTQAGGQYQVVIGNDVPEVFAEIGKISKLGSAEHTEREAEGDKGNLFNRFIKMIAAIFTPFLWALAGTGLLKAFLAATVTFGWIDAETSTYQVLNALSDAFIHFLPVAIAFTAARYFRASEFTSMAIAAALVYPTMSALVGAEGLTFFGIPFTMVSYVSSVIPVIVVVWIQSHMEKVLYKYLPAAIRRFVTPMIVILLLVPFVFLAIGPLSAILSGWLASGIGWIFDVLPWLGGAIMGAMWQVFVIFGLHWGFVPIMTVEITETGMSYLLAPLFAAVLAQAAAVAGVWVKTRNRNLRSLAAPATLSGFLAGITEPAIYGINLPLKRPFAFGIVGGTLGGALISMGAVATNSFVVPSGLSIPALFGNGSMVLLGLGLAVAIVVPFLLVTIFGFKDPVDEDAASTGSGSDSVADLEILSPIDGTVVPLSEVPDVAFAEGSLWKGAAIRPRSGAVYAPFAGVVVAAFPTAHAIGLRHADGAEVLIHVGIDTVKLGGEHFTMKVESGQNVAVGDLLIEFDAEAIEKAGYDLVTPVIVTNSDLYPGVRSIASGPIAHGEPLFEAVPVDSAATAK